MWTIDAKCFKVNETPILPAKPRYEALKEDKPGFWPGLEGRTTVGTLGRCTSTVANRARSSDGGGVLIRVNQASRCSLLHIACHKMSREWRVESDEPIWRKKSPWIGLFDIVKICKRCEIEIWNLEPGASNYLISSIVLTIFAMPGSRSSLCLSQGQTQRSSWPAYNLLFRRRSCRAQRGHRSCGCPKTQTF